MTLEKARARYRAGLKLLPHTLSAVSTDADGAQSSSGSGSSSSSSSSSDSSSSSESDSSDSDADNSSAPEGGDDVDDDEDADDEEEVKSETGNGKSNPSTAAAAAAEATKSASPSPQLEEPAPPSSSADAAAAPTGVPSAQAVVAAAGPSGGAGAVAPNANGLVDGQGSSAQSAAAAGDDATIVKHDSSAGEAAAGVSGAAGAAAAAPEAGARADAPSSSPSSCPVVPPSGGGVEQPAVLVSDRGDGGSGYEKPAPAAALAATAASDHAGGSAFVGVSPPVPSGQAGTVAAGAGDTDGAGAADGEDVGDGAEEPPSETAPAAADTAEKMEVDEEQEPDGEAAAAAAAAPPQAPGSSSVKKERDDEPAASAKPAAEGADETAAAPGSLAGQQVDPADPAVPPESDCGTETTVPASEREASIVAPAAGDAIPSAAGMAQPAGATARQEAAPTSAKLAAPGSATTTVVKSADQMEVDGDEATRAGGDADGGLPPAPADATSADDGRSAAVTGKVVVSSPFGSAATPTVEKASPKEDGDSVDAKAESVKEAAGEPPRPAEAVSPTKPAAAPSAQGAQTRASCSAAAARDPATSSAAAASKNGRAGRAKRKLGTRKSGGRAAGKEVKPPPSGPDVFPPALECVIEMGRPETTRPAAGDCAQVGEQRHPFRGEQPVELDDGDGGSGSGDVGVADGDGGGGGGGGGSAIDRLYGEHCLEREAAARAFFDEHDALRRRFQAAVDLVELDKAVESEGLELRNGCRAAQTLKMRLKSRWREGTVLGSILGDSDGGGGGRGGGLSRCTSKEVQQATLRWQEQIRAVIRDHKELLVEVLGRQRLEAGALQMAQEMEVPKGKAPALSVRFAFPRMFDEVRCGRETEGSNGHRGLDTLDLDCFGSVLLQCSLSLPWFARSEARSVSCCGIASIFHESGSAMRCLTTPWGDGRRAYTCRLVVERNRSRYLSPPDLSCVYSTSRSLKDTRSSCEALPPRPSRRCC